MYLFIFMFIDGRQIFPIRMTSLNHDRLDVSSNSLTPAHPQDPHVSVLPHTCHTVTGLNRHIWKQPIVIRAVDKEKDLWNLWRYLARWLERLVKRSQVQTLLHPLICVWSQVAERPYQIMLFSLGNFTLLAWGECPCTYCESLWIRASAKWLNVNMFAEDER